MAFKKDKKKTVAAIKKDGEDGCKGCVEAVINHNC